MNRRQLAAGAAVLAVGLMLALPGEGQAQRRGRGFMGGSPAFDGYSGYNPTRQTGTVRQFVSPPLEAGKSYEYTIRAQWQQDGQAKDDTRTVTVQAGGQSVADFTSGQGGTPTTNPPGGTNPPRGTTTLPSKDRPGGTTDTPPTNPRPGSPDQP